MKTSDFSFDLPKELIAQTPLVDRSASRLLVLERGAATAGISHRHFRDLPSFLRAGDCLVLNETKVIPARLIGRKPTGAVIEVLLLKRIDLNRWEVLIKPGRKARKGAEIEFSSRLRCVVVDELEDGIRVVEFQFDGVFEEVLDELGEMPLPPYIHEKLDDRERYNTVYAEHRGSAAAPTAGLHFTPELLREIEAMGVRIARITLHVGLGTFRPVQVEEVETHRMHSEFYQVSREAADCINDTKASGGRVIAVGTTTTRTLETVGASGKVEPSSGETDIFIYPGYRFAIVDALVTNFHLPESTLMMLVSALAGRERILEAYRVAVEERYRFFSFGDAMLIC